MRWSIAMLGLFIAPVAFAQPAKDSEREADEAILREQRLPTSGAELLQILRDLTPAADTIDQVAKHVARLRAANYTDRLKATSALVKMGPVVRPLIENMLREGTADAETAGRLREVIDHFPADKDFAAAAAAARLIARDQPEKSLRVLLDFVPYASNEQVRQPVQLAINAVALVDKKPPPALMAELKNASPAKRAAAGEAIIRVVGTSAKEQIAPLMKDAHPLVRYQIGMALVEKNDKAGLPLLIQTIADSPADRAQCALDLLYRAAGENAPAIYYEGKRNAADVSAQWQKWHQKHEASLDLAKQLARTELGFTVISATALVGAKGAKNKVFELGPDKTVRWEFEAPRSVLDVHVIGPNRLLLAEYYDRRVTERDFKGNILRQITAALPVACQRLPNGDTFIVTRQQIFTVDRDGKTVFSWAPKPASITTAQRLPNGQIAVVTPGRCALLDPQGRELKSFALGGAVYALGGNIEVLANNRILVPLYNMNMIVEFDWAGNKLWQAKVNRPGAVNRLANGHTIVTAGLGANVTEIDRDGQEVWSYQTDGRLYSARKR
jgi:hypothetical protein